MYGNKREVYGIIKEVRGNKSETCGILGQVYGIEKAANQVTELDLKHGN
ncbi:hypothetical protein J7E81_18920 [Bacillus sp. ISL-18]|nr:hypothetical protein [Bacillus sp. ISL-18]MBT2657274.1 hypothetical protein [Bacillus sp. ISL-18]